MAFGFFILVAVFALPVVFIMGAKWASENLLGPLSALGWVVLAINAIILLPLSLFRRLRDATGAGIYLSSYLFGLISWLLGFILTYYIWGAWAVVLGIFIMGGGVVPMALIATAINGYWGPFVGLLILSIVTVAARIGGQLISDSGN